MKLADVFSNYRTVRLELTRAIDGLSQDQLDWTAPDHPNSIRLLLIHIAETEYFWISAVVLGRPDNVDRDLLEQARQRGRLPICRPAFAEANNLRKVQALLDHSQRLVDEYLNAENIDDWDSVFYSYTASDGNVERVSRRWVTWNLVEHQARHRGQIFMLMRMQGLEVPNV